MSFEIQGPRHFIPDCDTCPVKASRIAEITPVIDLGLDKLTVTRVEIACALPVGRSNRVIMGGKFYREETRGGVVTGKSNTELTPRDVKCPHLSEEYSH